MEGTVSSDFIAQRPQIQGSNPNIPNRKQRSMVAAQLVDRPPLQSDIYGSNPVIRTFFKEQKKMPYKEKMGHKEAPFSVKY